MAAENVKQWNRLTSQNSLRARGSEREKVFFELSILHVDDDAACCTFLDYPPSIIQRTTKQRTNTRTLMF